MAVDNIEIGKRIREMRELSDYSVSNLAGKLGISEVLFEKYESGEEAVPLTTIMAICEELQVSFAEILTGIQPHLHRYSIVRKDKGVAIERFSEYEYQDLAYLFANKKVAPLMVTIEPTQDNGDPHMNCHIGQEFHYCVEGSYIFVTDRNETVINEGDSVYFDSSMPHGMRVTSDKPAKILVIVI